MVKMGGYSSEPDCQPYLILNANVAVMIVDIIHHHPRSSTTKNDDGANECHHEGTNTYLKSVS